MGLRSNLDVVQARQAQMDAQQQLATAKYNTLIAYLELLNSAGVLNNEQYLTLFQAA
ncbi:MAG: hypothetical protein IKH45_06665 [Neisseriaceae bacterium]|nr:hypothetical protein [Neisseriaceae bacterium]